ncbi:hypothetical protein [Nocardia vinacea]|uniref:hypothetical protein n=1 Tax=Nocardia vinacea TaxID=96468 RepID=UPI0002F03A2E|nr:hypothetical protein [Nocardia vinacea]
MNKSSVMAMDKVDDSVSSDGASAVSDPVSATNPDESHDDSAPSTVGAEASDAGEYATENAAAAEDGVVAVADAAEGTGKSGRSWRRLQPRPLTGILLLLVVVSVILAAVFGWKLETRNDRQAAGTAALAAAQDFATALTSIDSSHIDSDFATVLNGATGEFKSMYSKSADQLKPMLLQAKSVSKGHVVAASVQSASENQAVIMLFVDAEITNVTNPTPRVDRNRILMTMDRVDGRWLTSKVELP